MPALAWAAIWAFISAIIKPVTKAVLVALGLSLVVYTGLELAFNELFDYLMNGIDGLPAAGVYVLKATGFVTALNQWAGAVAGVIAYRNISGGAKMIWKKPA